MSRHNGTSQALSPKDDESHRLQQVLRKGERAFLDAHPLRTVRVEGTDWTYLAGGNGSQTVLWLHGAMGQAQQMQRFVEPLAHEARFVAPTFPAVASIKQVAAGLDAVMAREGAARFVVAGGSFGGMVAQAYAARRPEQMTGLVLFDTAAPDAAAAIRLGRKMSILRWLPWPPLRWLLRRSLGRLLRVDGDVTPLQEAQLRLSVERFGQSLCKFDKHTLLAHAALSGEFFELTESELWRGPTLIIRSSDDPGSANRPDLAAAYPQAEVVELEGVGHLGALLKTDVYLDACRRFLAVCVTGGHRRRGHIRAQAQVP